MRVIIHPQKGNYKILFLENQHVRGTGFADFARTQKGVRPVQYRLRWGGRSQFRNTPTRDLIASLRKSDLFLTGHDDLVEAFLSDLQIPFDTVDLCRICLLEERITPLNPATAVRYGESESICPGCAKRELRRELAHMGRIGQRAMSHMEALIQKYRDVDKVLASIQPENIRMRQTLFDRLEAHPIQKTARLEELPLPRNFVDVSGVETLMPAQQLAVEAGLLFGKDLLVVSATASGKTFIGEMAGLKNLLEGRGQMIFLVPLVALAVQKYQRFLERYGEITGVGILIGRNRINLPENRPVGDRNTGAPVIVATYEGIDHLIRSGKKLKKVGTVVIDEVQMLEDSDRGHRLDGLIARLKFLAPKAQFLYLSATIGLPKILAKKLGATLVRYDERPVALERYLLFLEHKQKIPTIKRLCEEEFRNVSSKGFHGQTIVFTHSRARCHVIAEALGPSYGVYHAGLTSQERRSAEALFLSGKLKAVVTTAALGAGVDFPASQVIFDSLAMGISWLSVQEFSQMAGRAGRPDYHDLGKVVILAEPGASYVRNSPHTEEEVAMRLLKGEMEEVAPEHDLEASSEEFAANAVVCNGNERDLDRICSSMVGTLEPVLPVLIERGLAVRSEGRIELSDMARIMAEHFIGVERLTEILALTQKTDDPLDILTELECSSREQDREKRVKKRRR
ncbi:MAG TPA: DEAD/DEAH box helicase [Methanoregulaceae archaeon]|nr:MAG: DEAD/DEAH box helicase [Methanolinea sp.]HON80790.1 DEAD/DEAH box helicase [Methanoregulaceae archaeon]HPD09525.1 DEAD/DEAH box helicase [Methanoregulaceae archaeon]HRT14684.1 DEAD/DEAH box helicase [Methanoregulaceae archaeon]HRU30257.1 DEAD/DEAH box helicase [Methanoregulaceae archaeon]